MAIIKRMLKNGNKYQVKERGSDGYWITETFDRKGDAEKREAELKLQRNSGLLVSNVSNQVTVSDYFQSWDKETKNGNISPSWREDQIKYFHRYVEPSIGNLKLQSVLPAHISKVLVEMTSLGRAPQMRLHVYSLMRKMFGDAIELFEILHKNPVKRALRPKVPKKETKYLNVEEAKTLLIHIKERSYEVAINLGLYAGLRTGEIQALKWGDIDFNERKILVRSTFVRKESRIQDYPKGKQWRRVSMPPELTDLLKYYQKISTSEFVATLSGQSFLGHNGFYQAIRRYCVEAKVSVVSPHGLRHSSSELYMSGGASRDDLRILFGHSSSAVTDRYIHDQGSRLESIANVILLFPGRSKEDVQTRCSQIVPKSQNGGT